MTVDADQKSKLLRIKNGLVQLKASEQEDPAMIETPMCWIELVQGKVLIAVDPAKEELIVEAGTARIRRKGSRDILSVPSGKSAGITRVRRYISIKDLNNEKTE